MKRSHRPFELESQRNIQRIKLNEIPDNTDDLIKYIAKIMSDEISPEIATDNWGTIIKYSKCKEIGSISQVNKDINNLVKNVSTNQLWNYSEYLISLSAICKKPVGTLYGEKLYNMGDIATFWVIDKNKILSPGNDLLNRLSNSNFILRSYGEKGNFIHKIINEFDQLLGTSKNPCYLYKL